MPDVAKLVAKIGADNADLTTGLRDSESKITTFVRTSNEILGTLGQAQLGELGNRMRSVSQTMRESITETAQTISQKITVGVDGAKASITGMADATKAETDKFNESLAMTEARLLTLKGVDPLAELREQFKGLVPDSELEKLLQLRNDTQEVKDAERQAAQEARDMAKAQEQSFRDAANEARQAARAEVEAAKEASRAQQQAYRDSERAAHEFHQRVQAGGAAAQMVGQQVSQAGHEIVGGLGEAIKTSLDFETEMRNANTMVKAAEPAYQKMRKAILDLSADPSVTDGPVALAKGLYDVVSRGYQGAKALEIETVAARGAAAGMTETAIATDALTGVLNSGIGGIHSTRDAMDLMVREVDMGGNRFRDLAKSIGPVLVPARALKVTMQELTAAQANMTKSSINMATTNTALKNLFGKMMGPSGAMVDAMDAIGVKYGSTALKGSSFYEWLVKTNEAMKEYAKTHDSITIGKRTFPVKGPDDLIPRLFPDSKARLAFQTNLQNLDRYKELLDGKMGAKSATQGKGATALALEEQLKAPGKQLKSLMAQLESLKIKVGDILGPALSPLVGWAQQAATWFGKLPEPVQKFGVILAAIAGIGLTVGGTILSMIGNVIMLGGALEAAGVTMGGVGAVLTGPLGIALAAAALLTAGLVLAWRNDWGHIREHTAAFIAWITPYLTSAWENIKRVLWPCGVS